MRFGHYVIRTVKMWPIKYEMYIKYIKNKYECGG